MSFDDLKQGLGLNMFGLPDGDDESDPLRSARGEKNDCLPVQLFSDFCDQNEPFSFLCF